MKGTITFFLVILCSATCWCQSDSTGLGAPTIMHINTIGATDSIFQDNIFTVQSFVSPELFDKWNPDGLKSQYKKKSVLIIVARQDSGTKTKFVTSFYRYWLCTGSKEKAYERAIEEVGPNTEIKHILILNE